MQKRPTSVDSVVHEHLRLVYDASATADVEAGVEDLVGRYRKRLDNVDRPTGLTERDVMLITYGDTLNQSGAAPLEVLHRFHSDHLRGVFDLVHILPFHPYSSDDGFSVIDYYAVRSDLGDWDAIQALSRDCRVMADAVVNHVSSQSGWFEGYLAGDPKYADFFIDCDPDADLDTVVRPRTSPLLTAYEDSTEKTRHIWTTFSADQADLNFANPKVLLAVIEVLFFLVSQGARLLRLDAVTFLWKQPGTSSANMAETHALIKVMRSAMAMLSDEVIILTETNVPHRENIAYFGDGHDEAQMVYNFALPPLIAHSFIAGNSRKLRDWAATLALPSEETCFLNFSASHDGVGVRPVEEILDENELGNLVGAAKAAGGQVSSRAIAGEERPYELNCTFLDLISKRGEPEDVTAARFIASQAIVLTMPGVPAVYIQSLLGTRNDFDLVAQTGRARSINRSQLDLADVERDLADSSTLRSVIFRALTGLIRARRKEPAFDPFAPCEVLDLDDRVFAIRRRPRAGDYDVIAVSNLTSNTVRITIDGLQQSENVITKAALRNESIELEAYEVLWLRRDGADWLAQQ